MAFNGCRYFRVAAFTVLIDTVNFFIQSIKLYKFILKFFHLLGIQGSLLVPDYFCSILIYERIFFFGFCQNYVQKLQWKVMSS